MPKARGKATKATPKDAPEASAAVTDAPKPSADQNTDPSKAAATAGASSSSAVTSARRGVVVAAVFVLLGALLLAEVDLVALRILHQDLIVGPRVSEPSGCFRLTGPVGAEDAVVMFGMPPAVREIAGLPNDDVIITGELDAGTHEFTNLADHGTAASTSPPGTLWVIDRLDEERPRLSPLKVPLPKDVTTMHTHGLGLLGDVLFAVNHAFRGGGERIERWHIERTPDANDGPPIRLTHVGAITGHDGDEQSRGAWTFTSRLNAAINDVAPVGAWEI